MAEKIRFESKQFKFTGDAGEYFRIWIVNLLLSIVTLGVYSAWAKVRTRQYFYRNTWVDESSFDYHGDPILILKGRLIIGAFMIASFFASIYSPLMTFALFATFTIAAPWIAVKAYSFNARNSSFRHVRFAFHGGLRESYQVFLFLPFLNIFTLGLLTPYVHWRKEMFRVSNHHFGNKAAATRVAPGEFYGMYVAFSAIAGLVFILTAVVILPMILRSIGPELLDPGEPPPSSPNDYPFGISKYEIFSFLVVALIYLPMALPYAYLRATAANLVYGKMTLAGQRFESKQQTLSLLGIYLSNVFGIAFSLGLLIPWAKVRLAQYRASCTVLRTTGDWEVLADQERAAQSAVGEAAADFGDFDFGL